MALLPTLKMHARMLRGLVQARGAERESRYLDGRTAVAGAKEAERRLLLISDVYGEGPETLRRALDHARRQEELATFDLPGARAHPTPAHSLVRRCVAAGTGESLPGAREHDRVAYLLAKR